MIDGFQIKELVLDSPECGIYEGWVDVNDLWNGFQQPYFSFEQACEILDNFHLINSDERMHYDQDRDCFSIDDGYDILEEYSGVEFDGETYYPIGYSLWAWTLLEEH